MRAATGDLRVSKRYVLVQQNLGMRDLNKAPTRSHSVCSPAIPCILVDSLSRRIHL
jgi:hypothetical protein